jgi:enoyl-CoA hydratase/carnithine racemase
MSAEVHIRVEGRVGRITVDRPKQLNAITHDIVRAVNAALPGWAADDDVRMLVIDAVGEKAFCAGGDLQQIYAAGIDGDAEPARAFWRDEYAMNAALFRFPKPVACFLQGYTMGGGVGLGCHGSHRIVGDTSRIAMPETSIGLVPDVGGSLLLARAPGRLGEYLGTTAARMGPGDAIHAGFADYYLPEDGWEALKADLVETGDWEAVDRAAQAPPESPLAGQAGEIDRHFAGETMGDILRSLGAEETAFTAAAREAMARGAPLAMACAVEMVHRLRGPAAEIERALDLEYRYTHRAIDQGDFLEGIRAAIIDKDRAPRWRHDLGSVPAPEVARMLMPLGEAALRLGGTS